MSRFLSLYQNCPPIRIWWVFSMVFGTFVYVHLTSNRSGRPNIRVGNIVRNLFQISRTVQSRNDATVSDWAGYAANVTYFTDVPRNQTTVDFSAGKWENVLTRYKQDGLESSDAVWMPITYSSSDDEKLAKWTLANSNNNDGNRRRAVIGYVYSAFLDTRFAETPLGVFVRVLGVVRRNKLRNLSCRFYQHNEPPGTVAGSSSSPQDEDFLVKADVELQWQQMGETGFPFQAVFINCAVRDFQQVSSSPISVSVYYHHPDNRNNSGPLRPPGNKLLVLAGRQRRTPERPAALDNFWEAGEGPSLAFCVRHLQNNYKDVVQLVEYIELHAILGGTDFHFYGHSYSRQVECILKEYYQRGNFTLETGARVHFHNWEFPFLPKTEVTEAGPETAMNDCLYRSMTRQGTHFVANGDLDEIFLPTAIPGPGALYETLHYLARADPNAGAFEFTRFQIPRQFPDDEAQSGQGHLRLRTMRKTMRQTEAGLSPKLVVLPERVTGLKTHWVRDLTAGHHQSPVDDIHAGRVNHYRLVAPGELTAEKFKIEQRRKYLDRAAHAYADILNERILKFLTNVPSMCNVTAALWTNDAP